MEQMRRKGVTVENISQISFSLFLPTTNTKGDTSPILLFEGQFMQALEVKLEAKSR